MPSPILRRLKPMDASKPVKNFRISPGVVTANKSEPAAKATLMRAANKALSCRCSKVKVKGENCTARAIKTAKTSRKSAVLPRRRVCGVMRATKEANSKIKARLAIIKRLNLRLPGKKAARLERSRKQSLNPAGSLWINVFPLR